MDAAIGLLRQREELYRSLLAEADRLLATVGETDEEGLASTTARRQEILESIQKIDSELAGFLGRQGAEPPSGVAGILGEFAERRKVLTEKIREKDALVIALANGRIEEIKLELGGLAKGRSALQAYDTAL
jgi:hypothetical protein